MDISFVNFSSMRKIILYVLIIELLIACRPNLDYDISGYSQKIIVEGSIATNEYPNVYLSLNVPFSEALDSTTILNSIIRTAKVTISDGENTEILTSRWDKTHFPPYVYKGYDIKGVEGKTYYLTVEYRGYTVKSQTTIPTATNISQIYTQPVQGIDALRKLSITLPILSAKKNAFRVFTRKSKDDFYRETPTVFNADFSLSGDNTFVLRPQPAPSDASYYEGDYFAVGDTVMIRLCTIDSVSTQFFKALTPLSSTSGVGSNLFMGEKDALKSNVESPGFGIWCGSGVRTYRYIIK